MDGNVKYFSTLKDFLLYVIEVYKKGLIKFTEEGLEHNLDKILEIENNYALE